MSVPASTTIHADGGDRHGSVCLMLGGARSGKSALAEDEVLRSGLEPVFLATARAGGSRDGRADRAAPRPARAGLDHP